MPLLAPPLAPEAFAGFDTWPLAFGRDGRALEPSQVEAALQALPGATDLLVIAHGWNNDTAEAAALYRSWLTQLRGQMGPPGAADARRFVVWRLHWPSKRFADAELIPGGAAGADDTPALLAAQLAHLADQIDRALADLADGPGAAPQAPAQSAALRAMRTLLPRLDDDEGAQDDFMRLARVLLAPELDAEESVLPDSFHSAPGPALLQRLGQRFKPRQPEGGGATVLLPDDDDGDPAVGGAAFLGNLFRGAVNGAQNLLNLFTYYQMKQRAGEVGQRGLMPLLAEASARQRGLRLHLAGHSFGARLVTAALASRPAPASADDGARSVLLLQAAFSHNSFGRRFDGHQDGHFRPVFDGHRLNGPLLISHTARDRAVGLAYPIASRLRQQVASGLGDEKDPYGALGRNGALFVAEEADPSEQRLRPVGEAYAPFQPRRIYNLHGGDFIRGHGDVEGPEIAQAWWHALNASR